MLWKMVNLNVSLLLYRIYIGLHNCPLFILLCSVHNGLYDALVSKIFALIYSCMASKLLMPMFSYVQSLHMSLDNESQQMLSKGHF